MEKRAALTKGLAITGTILVWIPILAPIVFSLGRLLARHDFQFDYLMPAELFPVALVGSGLLIWASFRARAYRALLGGGLGAALIFLVGGQGLAVITGLASGAIEPTGWPWALVLGALALFTLAVIATGVGGILLLRSLFRPQAATAP